MKTQYYIFLLIVGLTIQQSLGMIHTPVLRGVIPYEQTLSLTSRNQLYKPANVAQAESETIKRSELSRRATCQIDNQCDTGSCCNSLLGKATGTCYTASTSKCCVADGSILPQSLSNFTGECCSYSSSGSFKSCPPSGSPSFSKCAIGDSCTSGCSSDAGCPSGDGCCFAPASNRPTDGRCFSNSQEMCCFDGRICNSASCQNIPSGGQCCGVDFSTGQFTFCNAGSYCNIALGNLVCTSTPYGASTNGSTTVPVGTGNTDSKKSTNLGLILGIAIPVGLLAILIIIFIIVFVRRHRKPKSEARIVQPTIPPAYNQSSAPMGMAAPVVFPMSIAPTPGYLPPIYSEDPTGTYAAMEGLRTSSNTVIAWSEIVMLGSIGKGSFGEVFKAKWHEAFVAVKRINPDLVNNPEALANFYGESEILKTLKPHPNTVLFFGSTEEPAGLIMEYCENGSLYQFLHSQAVIDNVSKKNIILGIARGMLHLHFYNIIHRDLAARNILLTKGLEVKVSDFGFSQFGGQSESQIQTPVGPVRWFPPEALRNHVFSNKTDVWSFGVVIWEIVTRKDPFEGKSITEVINGVTNDGLILEAPSDCPIELANIMRRCFQTNPADRPTFQEIITLLETEYAPITA